MATSQRLLGFAIFALLVAAIATAVVKGPGEEPLLVGPTTSPTPSETFTFPGPVPTESETGLFPTPTATETLAGPDVSPSDELPRTGGGSLLWAAALTLTLAAGGGALVLRAARTVS